MQKTKITHKQAIRQLNDLLEEAMTNNKNDPEEDIYIKDVIALEMAIKSMQLTGQIRRN
jgi:hypothetical protein